MPKIYLEGLIGGIVANMIVLRIVSNFVLLKIFSGYLLLNINIAISVFF